MISELKLNRENIMTVDTCLQITIRKLTTIEVSSKRITLVSNCDGSLVLKRLVSKHNRYELIRFLSITSRAFVFCFVVTVSLNAYPQTSGVIPAKTVVTAYHRVFWNGIFVFLTYAVHLHPVFLQRRQETYGSWKVLSSLLHTHLFDVFL